MQSGLGQKSVNERDYHDHHYASEAAAIEGSALFQRVHERAARQFLQCARVCKTHRVLSLGCGNGSIERLLAPYVGEIIGLDISAVAIEQAQSRCRGAALANVAFRVWLPESQAAESLGQFDVIAAFAFLHHLDDAAIRQTLLLAHKALRPGGMFYSADPSRRRLVGLFKRLVRKTYDRYHSPDERELDPHALAALVAAAGFSRSEIGYTDYFLGPLAWLVPATPAWLAAPLETLDNMALRMPLMRKFASSFCVLACTS
jgi:SAM-dependent methyltransferase